MKNVTISSGALNRDLSKSPHRSELLKDSDLILDAQNSGSITPKRATKLIHGLIGTFTL